MGLLFLVLPLAWPTLFFPLTWGSFFFLLAPFNRRFAEHSFLRDLERGDATPFARTLLAGLACGLIWEAGNFWARNRWIYTVPGLEGHKLFEMPLLGFLGFPPFAVECVAFVRALDAARERVARWRPPARAAARWGAAVLAAAGTLTVFVVSEPITNDSYHVAVAELDTLPEEPRRRLVAAGLRTPDEVARALGSDAGLERWSERTGVDPGVLRRIRDHVRLVRHRGLGAARARQLAALGVHTLGDLRGWDPEALAAALRRQAPGRPHPFLERRARVWLDGLGEAEGGVPPS